MPTTMFDCDVIIPHYDVITSDYEELHAESLRAWSVYVSQAQGWFNQSKGASSSESVSQESSDSLGYLTTSSSSSSSSSSNETTPVNETGRPLIYEASKPVRIPGKKGSGTWDDEGGDNAVWVRQNATNCPTRPSSNSFSPPKSRKDWNSQLTSRRYDNDSTGTRLSLPSNINDTPPDDSPVWLRRPAAVSDTDVYVTHYIDDVEDDVTPTTEDATYFYTFYQDYVPREDASYVLTNGHEDGVAVDCTAMPAGNKVSDLDSRFWRKPRSGSNRASGLPTPSQPVRPKSAEFTLDFTDAKESPYHRRKIRSPSAGEKTALGVTSRIALDNPASPSTKSPGLLRRVFGLRRSGSRDKEKNKSTDSLDNVINNNSSFPHKWFRSFSSNSNYQDVNQNCQAESVVPPIAIFSSDEDICSAPVTPQHSSCDSSPAVAYTKGHPLLCEPQLEERLSIVLEKQSKRPHDKDSDLVESNNLDNGKSKSDNARTNSPKRFFGWRDGLTLRKSSSKRSSSGPELPHLGTSPKKQVPKTDKTDSVKTKTSSLQNKNHQQTAQSQIARPNANRSKSADRAYARNRSDARTEKESDKQSGASHLPKPNTTNQMHDQKPRSKSSDRETRIQRRSAERSIPQPTRTSQSDQTKCSNPSCGSNQKGIPTSTAHKPHEGVTKCPESGIPSAHGIRSGNTADMKSNSADQIIKSGAHKVATNMRTQSGPLLSRRDSNKPRPKSQSIPIRQESESKPRPKSQIITITSQIPRTEPSRLKILKGHNSHDSEMMSKSLPDKSLLEMNSHRTVQTRTASGVSTMSKSVPSKASMDNSLHQTNQGKAYETKSSNLMSQSFPNGRSRGCQNMPDKKHYDSMNRSVPPHDNGGMFESNVDTTCLNKPGSRIKRPDGRIPIPVTHMSKQEYDINQVERRVIDACPRLERTMYRTARTMEKRHSHVMENRRSQSPQTSESSGDSVRPSPPRGGVERLVGESGRPYPPRGIAARYVVGNIGGISGRPSPPRYSVASKGLSESTVRIIPVTRQDTAPRDTVTTSTLPKLPVTKKPVTEQPVAYPERDLKSQPSCNDYPAAESENAKSTETPIALNIETMTKSLEIPKETAKENEISQMSVSQDSSTLSQIPVANAGFSGQAQGQIPLVASPIQEGKPKGKKRAPYRMMYQRYQTIELGNLRLQSDFNATKNKPTKNDDSISTSSTPTNTSNEMSHGSREELNFPTTPQQLDRGSDDHLFQSTASLPPRPTHQPRRTASPRRTAGCSPNRMTSPLKIALPRRSSSPYRSASPLAGTPDSPSHSFPTTPHEDYLDRVTNARRSWSKRRTGPSQEIDRSGEDARSMDSGIQQDHTPSFESLKMAKQKLEMNPQTFMDELYTMQKNGILCDHKIYVRNVCFWVHQIVLAAASSHLKMILTVKAVARPVATPPAVINEPEVARITMATHLDNIRPDVFKQVLAYSYGRTIELDQTNDCELYEAAHQLKIEHLRKVTEDFIKKQSITQYNCLRYLKFAEKFDFQDLLKLTREAVAEKLIDLQGSSNLMRITQESLVYLLTELFKSGDLNDQISCLGMLSTWVEGNAPSHEELEVILDHIDLWRLAPEVFLKVEHLISGKRGYARVASAWMVHNKAHNNLVNDLYKKFISLGLDPVNNLFDIVIQKEFDRLHFVTTWLESSSPMGQILDAVLTMVDASKVLCDDLSGLQRIYKGEIINILYVTCWWLGGNSADKQTTQGLLSNIPFDGLPVEYLSDEFIDFNLPSFPCKDVLVAHVNHVKRSMVGIDWEEASAELPQETLKRNGSSRRSLTNNKSEENEMVKNVKRRNSSRRDKNKSNRNSMASPPHLISTRRSFIDISDHVRNGSPEVLNNTDGVSSPTNNSVGTRSSSTLPSNLSTEGLKRWTWTPESDSTRVKSLPPSGSKRSSTRRELKSEDLSAEQSPQKENNRSLKKTMSLGCFDGDRRRQRNQIATRSLRKRPASDEHPKSSPGFVAKAFNRVSSFLSMGERSSRSMTRRSWQNSPTSPSTPNEEHVMQVVRRRTPSHSPEKGSKERPKSEVLMVRWSQDVTDNANDVTGRRKKSPRERPKSDLGGGQMVTEALEHYEHKERYDSPTGLPDFRLKREAAKMKGRRELRAMRQMSTPQPIKLRLERSPPTKKASHAIRRSNMQRSRSAPDLVDGVKKTKRSAFQVGSAHAGDLAVQMSRFTYEDEDDTSEDAVSWGAASETSSVSSAGKHAFLEEIFEEQPVYVEALWHHVTMDPEELGFRAGDVIQVTDMADKDWWWGNLDKREGWFPASFVRLRANQEVTVDDLAQKVKDGSWDSQRLLQQYNNGVLSKDQARTNVVNEIMSAEREYVKNLNDVVQGFVEKSRGRPEMFPEDRLALIYCNIETICKFSEKLLADLEQAFNAEQPEQSQLGHVFLKHKNGFEIYSDYCNNHPQACEELRMLQKHLKYQHFFEGCRVLQKMKEIPLEGFLLTPVQKICKYPLQLAELLKYTKTGHPDYQQLQAALGSMRSIAMMINERKRKLESIEKLEQWQASVQDWEGADLLERSSELIHQGDLTKINSSGWSQERSFFLFDHQLIYCKKLDTLFRYGLNYKGRIDLDNCEIIPVKDGKDPQLNVTIRHGWKIHDKSREKWFVLCASSEEERQKWLASFDHERKTIKQDDAAGFDLEDYRKKAAKIQSYRYSNHPNKDKSSKSKTIQGVYGHSPESLQAFHSHGTVPRDGLQYASHPRKTKRGILGFMRRSRP